MAQTTQKQPGSTSSVATGAHAEASNRVQLGWQNRLLARPEIGALVAAIVILIFFLAVAPAFRSAASFSTVLYAASTIGIVAVGVGMLMIGGEFDLSAGVMVFSTVLVNSMFSYYLGINLWVGAAVALLFALGVGFLNGFLVMKTGIPSFLITLGSFFVLQGANLGVTKVVTGAVISPNISRMDGYASLRTIFAHEFHIGTATINITVLWWLFFVALSSWILNRTRIGNWIYAVGGNAASARAVGVPVMRVKIGLFMTVSFLAWFTGMHQLYMFNTVQANNGVGDEFLFIIAVVVGGTLMTGGYGNAIGVAIGAFIFGMTKQCLVYAGWDPNWFKAFLGVMLLLAVVVNLYVKKLSTARKVG
ncbi:MAG: ABC transporter permease [Actinomycetales bacterium]